MNNLKTNNCKLKKASVISSAVSSGVRTGETPTVELNCQGYFAIYVGECDHLYLP